MRVLPVLLTVLAVVLSFQRLWAGEKECKVTQDILAFNPANSLAVVVQSQDCSPKISRLGFWVVDLSKGEPTGPFLARHEPGDDRYVKAVLAGVGQELRCPVVEGGIAGLLLPHSERQLRQKGRFFSPLFPDGTVFVPEQTLLSPADPVCGTDAPPNGLSVVSGQKVEKSATTMCVVKGKEGRVDSTYLRFANPGWAAPLDLRRQINLLHGKVINLENRLNLEGPTPAIQKEICAIGDSRLLRLFHMKLKPAKELSDVDGMRKEYCEKAEPAKQ